MVYPHEYGNVQPFGSKVVPETGIEISLDDTTNDGVWVTQLLPARIRIITEETSHPKLTFNQVTSPDGYNFELLGGNAALDGFLEIGIQIRSNDANCHQPYRHRSHLDGVLWTADGIYDQTGDASHSRIHA